jgi:probable rRNA maturation factor
VISIAIANLQSRLKLDARRYRRAIRSILQAEGHGEATISLAVVDDARIRALHRRFLNKDSATDVLSFVLSDESEPLEGEIVVSGETARRMAARLGWKAEDELLLYVIHGALHLVGYDDTTRRDARVMRQRERFWLARFGLTPPEVAAPPRRKRDPRGRVAREAACRPYC